MSRKFVTERELAFIDQVNWELIQCVAPQPVYYYAIDTATTQVDDLYNESVRKTWHPPVEIDGRVKYGNPNSVTSNFGVDSQYSLEVYFHTKELIDRNVQPREGDFIEYGQVFFEITSVTQPQQVFGQIQDKIMTKCVCVQSREGQFAAGRDSEEEVDHSHPIENSKAVNK